MLMTGIKRIYTIGIKLFPSSIVVVPSLVLASAKLYYKNQFTQQLSIIF